MKRTALLGISSLLALGTVGCNTQRITTHSAGFAASAPVRMPTYALAVTVQGGLQPTPAQWALIQAKVADELSWRGAVLVTDIDLADKVIRVDFRPNPMDPEGGGHITVLGVRSNPYRGYATTTMPGPYRSSYSFANAFSSPFWWGSDYYNGYGYNYLGPWENGYTSGTTTVVTIPKPPSTRPPHRDRPNHREVCPPDQLEPRGTPRYASSEPVQRMTAGTDRAASYASTNALYNSPMPSTGSAGFAGRWTGERSAWRSELGAARQQTLSARESSRSSTGSSGSRGERSYSRSGSSGSRSEGSWWSGRSSSSSYDSSRSYSSGSYSDYSGSSGSMTASSSSSSSSYSSPVYDSPSSSSSSSSSSGSMTASSSDSQN